MGSDTLRRAAFNSGAIQYSHELSDTLGHLSECEQLDFA